MLWILILGAISISQALRITADRQSSGKLHHPRDVRKPSFWDHYSAKGQTYYSAWKHKTGPDVLTNPNWMSGPKIDKDVYRSRHVAPSLNLELSEVLESAGYPSASPDYLSIVVRVPPSGPPPRRGERIPGWAVFDMAVDAGKGVLVVKAAYWRDAKEGRHLSDVMWWAWTEAVEKAAENDPEPNCDGMPTDYSGLTSMWRSHVINTTTIALIKYAIGGKGKGVYKFQPYDSDNTDNGFWPLIASPNGCAIIFMLTDHKDALKGKAIKQLVVKTIEQSPNHYKYYMWADLVLPPPGF